MAQILKQNIIFDYMVNIRSRAQYAKKMLMRKIEKRYDVQSFMLNMDKSQMAMKLKIKNDTIHDGRLDNPMYQRD